MHKVVAVEDMALAAADLVDHAEFMVVASIPHLEKVCIAAELKITTQEVGLD